MKNVIVIFSLLSIPFFGFSQTETIQNFYQKYMSQENVTNVSLQGWVLKLAADFVDEETEERILQKITKLRVMVMEDGNMVKKEEYQSLMKNLKKDEFETLMNVREGNQKIDFLFRGTGDEVTNVLILVNGEDEFVMLSLEGNLNFSDLNDIQIDVEGGEHFKKIPEKNRA